MRPVCVFAKGPGEEIERLRADLRGRWRQAARAVMVLLSLHGLSAAQIAVLLDCHPATVRRRIGRFNTVGMAGLADRPRRPLSRPRGGRHRGPAGRAAAPGSGAGRGRDPPEPAAARTGQLDAAAAARRSPPPAGTGRSPSWGNRGDHRAVDIPAGRRRAADFIALLRMLAQAFSRARRSW
jgi:hypothetical protein